MSDGLIFGVVLCQGVLNSPYYSYGVERGTYGGELSFIAASTVDGRDPV